MFSYMNVVITAGHTLPEAFASKVLEAYPTAVGYAYADQKEGLVVGIVNEPFPIKDLLELCEEFKDRLFLISFMKTDQKPIDDDIQPFMIMLDAKDNAKLVAFIAGDTESWAKPNSTHSSAWFAAMEYLGPRINRLGPNLDFKKVQSELVDPLTRAELVNGTCAGKGSIQLLSEDGVLTDIRAKSDTTRGVFPWGWATDSLGQGATAPATTTEKKLSFGVRKTPSSATIEVQQTEVVAQPLPDGVHSIPEKERQPNPAEKFPAELFEKKSPPNGLSNGAKKKWYYKNNADRGSDGQGKLPDGWTKSSPVYVAKSGVTKQQIKDFRSMAAATFQKDVTTHHIPAPQPAVVSSTRKLPVLSPGETKGIQDVFLTNRVKKVLETVEPDVEYFKTYRERNPSFFQRAYGDFEKNAAGVAGLDIQTGWDFETRLDLCTEWPSGGAVLMMDLNVERELLKAQVAALKTSNMELNALLDDEYTDGEEGEPEKEETPPVEEPKIAFGTRK